MPPDRVDPNEQTDSAGYPIRGIQEHALIGNLRTAALVSTDGTIESMCIPYFDSPSVFARILDADKGGHFAIQPRWPFRPKQTYAPNSNVLNTKFLSNDGVAVLTDLLVPRAANSSGSQTRAPLPWLIRKIESIRGTVPLRMECAPAFNYCRDKHQAEVSPTFSGQADGSSSTMTRSLQNAHTSRKVVSPLPPCISTCVTSPGRRKHASPIPRSSWRSRSFRNANSLVPQSPRTSSSKRVNASFSCSGRSRTLITQVKSMQRSQTRTRTGRNRLAFLRRSCSMQPVRFGPRRTPT